MEPSTPPSARNLRDGPTTPATPRFGTFEDLPDAERKHARTRTPHRRKRAAAELATPRQTPHKRKVLITPRQQQPLFHRDASLSLVEEDAEHEEAETEAETETESSGVGIELSENSSAESSDEEDTGTRIRPDQTPGQLRGHQIQDQTHTDKTHVRSAGLHAEKAAEPYVEWGHPHQDKPPPNVPGMWYVFRGKKVFRPLPAGAKPVEPVTLFKKEIDERRRVAESEEDTDVEHAW